jgi:phage shock protein C
MNCPVCGKSIEEGARFCSACGHKMYFEPAQAYAVPTATRFVRPRHGRMIAGVCLGIAQAMGWDVAIVRLGVALLVLFGCGAPLLGYFIAWIVMPNGEFVMPYPMQTPPPTNTPGATVS